MEDCLECEGFDQQRRNLAHWNGPRVNVRKDHWLMDEEWRFVRSSEVAEVKKIIDFIDFESMVWDINLISRVFNDTDKECILYIPLS